MLLTSFCEVLTPKFIQWSIDAITQSDFRLLLPYFFVQETPKQTLIILVYGLVVATCIGCIGRFGWRHTLGRATHIANRELRMAMWSNLRHQSIRLFHRYPLGDLMNRNTGDLGSARFIFGFTLVIAFDIIFFVLLAVIAMLLIHPQLALAALGVLIFLPYPVAKLGHREERLHHIAQERLSHMSNAIAQTIATIRMQRASATEPMWQAHLKAEAETYAKRRFKVFWTGWKIYPIGAAPTVVAYAVLLFWGLRMIHQEQLTVGEFVALQSYIFLLQRPLFDLSACISEWQRGWASLNRIQEVIALPNPESHAKEIEIHKPIASNGFDTHLTVKNLTYTYPDATRPILRSIDFSLAHGDRLGITGKIGEGKTTLLYLLAGLLEGPAASIFINNQDIHKRKRVFFCDHVMIVPQKAFLFAASIRENLCLDSQFSEDQLWHVLEVVKLAHEIKNLKLGLNSIVGEWGINLSGGQKQRLCLARALLRPKPILLLDDCLSAVDAITEETILDQIDRSLSDKTIIWTAHRLSTLRLCQRVFKLSQGILVEVR